VEGAEKIEFKTTNPVAYRELMNPVPRGTKSTIHGYLFRPRNAPAKMPIVVISIGSRGFESGREQLYSEKLNDIGIASFVVDSFSPRGFTETASDQGRVSNAATASDALHAVRFLQDDPRFDADRIGILGYSRGGQVSVATHNRNLQKAILGRETGIAAHVGLYPSMNPIWLNPAPTKAPLLILLGGVDDRAPEAKARAYADRFTLAGGDMTVKTIPNAHHGFDSSHKAIWSDSINLSKVRILIDDDGSVFEESTGTRAGDDWGAFLAKMYEIGGTRGGTTGYGPNPREIAVTDVQVFLSKALRLKR
jgi:dienelactone hydrolase